MISFRRQHWNSGRTKLKDRPIDDALVSICKELPPRRYLEIGTREGGSLLAVLRHSSPPPTLIVVCDIWGSTHGGTGRGSHDHIAALIEAEAYAGEIRYLDGKSQELVPKLRLKNFDLVTVDGDHSPGPATEDLENAWPKVKPGGLLVFDDTNSKPLAALVARWSERDDASIVWASGRRPGCTVLEKLEEG